MKKLFLYLILLPLLGYSQTSTLPNGLGTEAEPYLIESLSNLQWFSENNYQWGSDKYYKQTANIDASSTVSWDSNQGFLPITIFNGHFDGGGHLINGLTINRPQLGNTGFFGRISSGSLVENMGLVNVNIEGKDNVGGLVGISYQGTIESCYTTGVVKSNGWKIGGLVGVATDASISNCYSHASVQSVNGSTWFQGGLIGITYPSAIVTNCYSTGLVYNGNTSSHVGGFIGGDYGSVVTGCFWDVESSGQPSSAKGTGYTTSEMQDSSIYEDADWSASIWSFVDMYPILSEVIYGCMDLTAYNYNMAANIDDASCVEVLFGCTDSTAYNFNSAADTDDESCVSVVVGCTEINSSNYNSAANIDDGLCISWEQLYIQLQEDMDAITPEDGITQADVDAAVALITPEDGVGQADVDSAYTEGVSSVDITTDNQAAFDAGIESVVVEECIELPTIERIIDLPEGWSMFGFTCLDSLNTITAFNEIADKVYIVKDEMGLSYLPEWSFNALGSLQFAEGYQIKMLEVVNDFQFCSTIATEDGVTQVDLDALIATYADWCLSDNDNDGVCDVDEVTGCMDVTMCNYVAEAEFDDASCYNNDLGCGCDNLAAEEGFDCEGNELVTITSYEIGDLVEGGIVFYIDETGEHGLVASMEDLGSYQWGCQGTSISGADSTAIGTGYQNSLDIVAGCSETNGAAYLSLNATTEGYTDWYLPSKDELVEMYNTIGNGSSEGNIGGFQNNYYWSSSEFVNSPAFAVYFSDGHSTSLSKGSAVSVRIIRAF